ncbi:MAG: 16S rRNA (uracil(1498)-N(3))-methyltransferase [Bacilli bacterium]|jgi:16S rRNA (uracil1498-N3)-methyltransferase|nr:16S rRNA (uracil(1498)-N(3))-methyltransferase [Bacilli bacterium]MCH4211016.1 16S rRNA (uracil(1498)-N(3))-methyltransferase [Bacilli bacterium]
MQRYFATIVGDKALLSNNDAHHLVDVMRAEVGENIEVADGGNVYQCVVASLDPLTINVVEEKKRECELPVSLLLGFALLKHGNDEMVYEKGTELGVSSFYPYVSSRTIVRPNGLSDKEKKYQRSEKIVKGACEQSKRSRLPEIHHIHSFTKILDVEADLKLFAYENKSDDVASLREALKDVKPGMKVLILIGPEGGFTPIEAEMAEEKGFRFVSLGRRILRAETASIYAASVFSYEVEGHR